MCYIGIHGTALKSTAVLINSIGEVLSIAIGAPLHLHEFSEKKNYSALTNLFNKLLYGTDPLPYSANNCIRICIACPGIRTEEDKDKLRNIVRIGGWTGTDVIVLGDAVATLLSGSLSSVGIVVIVGSGSVVFGRDTHGNTKYVGGWGPRIGDVSSGYEISRWALRAILNAHDGSDMNCDRLHDCVLSLLGYSSVEELVNWINTAYELNAKMKISEVIPAVIRAVEDHNDPVAKRILDTAAIRIANSYVAVSDVLDFPKEDNIVLFEGGVIENSNYLRSKIYTDLANAGKKVDPQFAKYKAVIGATIAALNNSITPLDNKTLNNLENSIHDLPPELRNIVVGPAYSRYLFNRIGKNNE